MILTNRQTQFLEQKQSFEQWFEQVSNYSALFSQSQQKSWLLYEPDSFQFSLLFFGLIAAGKTVVLPPNGQTMQIKQCFEHADIFVGSGSYEGVSQFDYSVAQLNQSRKNTGLSRSFEYSVDGEFSMGFPDDTPVIFFTSGSSGQSKAVKRTFGQLVLEVEVLEGTFCDGFQNDKLTDRTLAADENSALHNSTIIMSTVSHQHIYGLLYKMLWPIMKGRDVFLKEFKYPEHLVHQIKQFSNREVCLISSPAYYHRLVKDNVIIEVKNQVSTLFSSGGPLKAEVAISLKEDLGKAPIEVYGSTETGGIAWRQKSILEDELWQTFSDIQCRYAERSQQLEIWSRYVTQLDISEPQSWYKTDDRVELIELNGLSTGQRFKLLGRTDRIVKIEEKRCSLDEIQAILQQHQWIEQSYVLAIGGKNGQRYATAAVIELSEQGRDVLAKSTKFKFDQQIKGYMKEYFEALVIPKKFRHLEALPFNTQGKLDKRFMESLFD